MKSHRMLVHRASRLRDYSRACAVVIALWFGVTFPAHAGPAVDRLHEFFKSVTSLRADFQQTILDANQKEVQSARGVFVMQRPNRFRWDYTKPYEQLIVADGAKLWIFDKDLEQVTVKKLDEALGNTPALLLSGAQALDKSYKPVEISEERDGFKWVELIPTDPDTAFSRLRLGFGAKSIEAMELIDGFGQTTRLRFSHVDVNPNVNANEFKFTPPKGVDVVGDER